MDQEQREKKYNEVFEAMYRYLEQRRRDDPAFNIARLEDMLNAAYFRQGDDWLGKGVLYEIKMAATVSAYESYLAVWREEEEQSNEAANRQSSKTANRQNSKATNKQNIK